MDNEKKVLCLKDGDKIAIKKDLKENLIMFGFSEELADKTAKIVFLESVSNLDFEGIGDDKIKKEAEILMQDFLKNNHKNLTPPMFLLQLLFDVIRKTSEHYIVIENDVKGGCT